MKIEAIIEEIVFAITWTEMYRKVFPKSELKKTKFRITHMVLIAIFSYWIRIEAGRQFVPFVCICVSGCLNGIAARRISNQHLVDSIFTYLVTKALWGGSLFITFFLLTFVGPLKYDLLSGLVICAVQLLLCSLFANRVNVTYWKIASSKYYARIMIAFETLFITLYGGIVVHQVEQRRAFGVYSLAAFVLFCIILFMWARGTSEQQKIEEEQSKHIDDLVRRAHKYKEVVPSTARELRRIQKQMLAEHRWEEAEEIGIAIDEVASLGETISADSMRELSEEPDFSTTGLRLLDSQLQNEQETAAEEGIHFSCMVTSPAAFLVKSGLIDQFHLQQMVGDLVRNAIRAVRLREGKDKRLLLIMGQSPEGYQIKLCDTGVPFPPEMLRHFGQRGLTTGGSGHGLADLREIMERCKGSITVTEYGEESSYTKAISLVMDGQGMLRIHSAPSGLDQERSLLEPAESGAK